MDNKTKIEADIVKIEARKAEIIGQLLPKDQEKLTRAKAALGAEMAGDGPDKKTLAEIRELESLIDGWQAAVNNCSEKIAGLTKDLAAAKVEIIQRERPALTAKAIKELAEIVNSFDNFIAASGRYADCASAIRGLEDDYKKITGDQSPLDNRPLAGSYNFGAGAIRGGQINIYDLGHGLLDEIKLT